MKIIIKTIIIHKAMSDTKNFLKEIQSNVEDSQNQGLEVEIQYSTNEHTQSAFIIVTTNK